MDASKVKIELDPMNAEETEKLLHQILDVRQDVIQRVNEIRRVN